ncbi:MAG: ThuA domain-containing protein [Halioglobus sp.]|nr:ThuA domain-containing protein [Halioglobus sp.]
MSGRQTTLLMLLLAVLFAAIYIFWQSRPEPDYGRKVLVFSKTVEYRHQSIAAGVAAITELGAEQKFNVVASEDARVFNDETLPAFQAVIFLNTTGDVLDLEQQVAFERYIQAGGGFVGIHAAADTEWKQVEDGTYWPWFQRLVGGVFAAHPENSDQVGKLTVRDNTHPATLSLPQTWQMPEEWYDFQRLSDGIQVLLTVDESSYTGATMGAGEEHPVAWYRPFDGGRSFYTALGHSEAAFANPYFLEILRGGMAYAMGDGAPLDYSKSRPQAWRFSRTVLDSNLNEPLKLAFSPEGDLYYVERRGKLQRYDFDQRDSVTVHTFEDVNSDFEYGLLGLVFDPDFSSNRWIYLFRTISKGDAGEHVLSRFKLHGDTFDAASEQVLLTMPADGTPGHESSHTGGDMQFDAKGNLFLTTGDDTQADDASYIDDRPGHIQRDAARSAGNTQDLRGKILRIRPRAEPDAEGRYYDIPQGNLFASVTQGRPEIYVMGLRNPYTMAFDSRTQRLYWGEVGPDARAADDRGPIGYDEINIADEAGNFGWPFVIADNEPYAYYDYALDKALDKANVAAPENRSRNNRGMKVLPPAQPAWLFYPYEESDKFFELSSGGRNALVAPIYYSDEANSDSAIKFPPYYDGKLIISDFIRRWLMVVTTDAQGRPETIVPIIDQPLSAPLDMAFGPDGALYVVEYGNDWFSGNVDSYLSRIEYYGGENPPPIAVATTTATIGAAPLATVLDASESYDRDGPKSELNYLWQWVANGRPGAVIGEQEVQPITLDEAGEHFVQLTVTDAGGQTATAMLRFVVGNEPPVVTVSTDGNRSFYWEDQPVSFAVQINDQEDGDTANGAIVPSDVTIKFGYVAGGEDLAKVLATESVDPVLAGRDLVTRGSDCNACHGVDSASIGPSFTQIAERYAQDEDAAAILRHSISEGASGKWGGNHVMPVHPNLSEAELAQIVAFVMSLHGTQDNQIGGLGLRGVLTFDEHHDDYIHVAFDKGVAVDLGKFYLGDYYFNARYTDKGTAQAPALQGQSTLLLRSPIVLAKDFDKTDGVTTVGVQDGFDVALVHTPTSGSTFSYGMLKGIDLTGIQRILVMASGVRPITSGGMLELRIDSKDSPAIASQKVDIPLIPSLESATVSLDVSQVDGVHDLYIGAPADPDTDADGDIQYAIVSLEFSRD